MSTVLEFAAPPPIWVAWVAFGCVVPGAFALGWFTKVKHRGHASGGEVRPRPAQDVGLDILEPEEQIGDDTLAMVAEDRSAADMWDSFEEADVHGIEVDDTAAEADMAPYSVIAANGPAVLAQGRALVAGIEAWRRHTDMEAWLGERGWL